MSTSDPPLRRASVILLILFAALPPVLAVQAQDGDLHHEQHDLDDQQDDLARRRRVVVLLDTSLSMDDATSDGTPRRVVARRALHQLLARLPDRTQLAIVGFSDRLFVATPQLRELTAARRAESLRFASTLIPDGNTHCGLATSQVLRRWPQVDAVFIITDGRARSSAAAVAESAVVGQLQRRFEFDLFWVLVDTPPSRALDRMLRLSGGQRW